MQQNREVDLLKRSTLGLQVTKQVLRKEALESINSQLRNPNIQQRLSADEETGNYLFKAVRAAIDKDFVKLHAEKIRKGSINERGLQFPSDCCDTISQIIRISTSKTALIPINAFIDYVKDCVKKEFHRVCCLTRCLKTLKDCFVKLDEYWHDIEFDEMTRLIALLKEAHSVAPLSEAFLCYVALIVKCAQYQIRLEFVCSELRYIHSVALQVHNTRDHSWLLNTVTYALQQFSQLCESTHKNECLQIGEDILEHILQFHSTYENSEAKKAILLHVFAIHVELHVDCNSAEMSTKWEQILSRISTFIFHWIETKDRIAFISRHGTVFLTQHFRRLVVAIFKQYKQMLSLESQPAKRMRCEPQFVEIIANMDNKMDVHWIAIFSEVIAACPHVITVNYLRRLLEALHNQVNTDGYVNLQGNIFICYQHLLRIEHQMKTTQAAFDFTCLWQSIFEFVLRTVGLNQSEEESHALLQAFFHTKPHLMDETGAFVKLYISNPLPLTSVTLTTLNVYATVFSIPENDATKSLQKRALIDSILKVIEPLETKSVDHFEDKITSEILCNLTLRYWTSDKSGMECHKMKANAGSNADIFHHLETNIFEAVTKFQSSHSLLQKQLQYALLVLNLSVYYQQCNQEYCSEALTTVLITSLPQIWTKLYSILEDLENTDEAVLNAALGLLHKLLQCDEQLNHIVKSKMTDKIIISLANAQSNIDNNPANNDVHRLQTKLLITKIFATFTHYHIPSEFSVQQQMKNMFYEFEGFEPCNSIDYQQWRILSDSLAHSQCSISLENSLAIANLLKVIYEQRHRESAIVADISQTLYHFFPHIVLYTSVRGECLKLLNSMHENRLKFGYAYSVRIIECLGQIAMLDTDFVWGKVNSTLCIYNLIAYIDDEHEQVQNATISALTIVLRNSASENTDVIKCDIFAKLFHKLKCIIIANRCTSNNSSQRALNCLMRLAVSDKDSNVTKLSLNAIIQLYGEDRITRQQLETCAADFPHSLNIAPFSKDSLQTWLKTCNKHLNTFPWIIYGCNSEEEFYRKHLKIIVPVILQLNRGADMLTAFSNTVNMTKGAVIEICNSVLIAEEIVLLAEGKSSVNNCRFAFKSLRCETIIKEKIGEIMTEILQYFLDPSYCTLDNLFFRTKHGLQLTRDGFTNVWLKLSHFLECNTTKYFYEHPSHMQQVLLNLRLMISEASDFASKILHFHRYWIFAHTLLETSGDIESTRVTFLIRDVLFTLINFIKHQDATMAKPAIRVFPIFIENVLLIDESILSEFATGICSVLIDYAKFDDAHALRTLKLIFLADNADIRNALNYLSPLPLNNEYLDEFRQQLLTSRSNDHTLEDDLVWYVAEKQISGRVEGLRYLRSKLCSDLKGRKRMYAQLNATRGVLRQKNQIRRVICCLIESVNSTNENESEEALLCLGLLGAGDLRTRILQSEEVRNEQPHALFVDRVIDVLYEYVVHEDVLLCKHSSVALYAILKTARNRNLLHKKTDIVKNYLKAFVTNEDENWPQEVCINLDDRKVFESLLRLWTLDALTYEEWISNLMINILNNIPTHHMQVFIPIIEQKVEFAIICFPHLINLLFAANQRNREFITLAIQQFLNSHWIMHNSNKTDAITMNKRALGCIVNVIYFIRLQAKREQNPPSDGLPFDVNYLHVAMAAQNCNAPFSALMYVEQYVHYSKTKRITASGRKYFGDDDSIIRSILSTSYNAIGESDALASDHLPEPTMRLPSRKMRNQSLSLTARDAAISNNSATSVQDLALHHAFHGYYNSAKALFRDIPKDETYYEIMWRLSRWDEVDDFVTPKQNVCFEANVCNILRGIQNKDAYIVNINLKQARLHVAKQLKDISLECCKAIYGPLSQLERLQELQEIFEMDEWIGRCDERDDIQYDFEYFEPRIAQRIEALNVLRKRDFPQAASQHSKHCIRLADIARKNGQFHIARRLIQSLKKDEPGTIFENYETEGNVKMIESQIDWDRGSFNSRELKEFLHAHSQRTFLRANILLVYGNWLASSQTAHPRTIINEYYLESHAILMDLDDINPKHLAKKHHLYYTIAKYADEQYQKTTEIINSPEFAIKVKSIKKMKETSRKLKESANNTDCKRAYYTFARFASVDESDINTKYTERLNYVTLAVRFYIQHIHSSKTVVNDIFRILSLWLENRGNQTGAMIAEGLNAFATFKILPIIPQLVPHIIGDDENFVKCVKQVIERCARDHPYHVIPSILCIANTNEDDKYAPDNAKNPTSEARILAANSILVRLSMDPILKQIVDETNAISLALIELAYYESKDSKDDVFRLPRNLKITNQSNLKYGIVPIIIPAVREDLNYSNVVTVHKFNRLAHGVRGINKPKLIECVGSDGIVRKMLLKRKDDLRQDAVMQQVFTILNDLFFQSEDTWDLQIRTYNVVPLSKRCGVLQWVDDTIPLSTFLTCAHDKYYPDEWKSRNARLHIHNACHESNVVRLQAYQETCDNITPVMHTFFSDHFLQASDWYERRRTYIQSVAASSMCGYILGIGDRHPSNILIDQKTGDVVHIDFGIAFELGHILFLPETVPFRLTREIVDGMGVCGVDGLFTRCCEKAMETLRRNSKIIETIVEVLLYDPLYDWSITPQKALSKRLDAEMSEDSQLLPQDDGDHLNVSAERALSRLKQKLRGDDFGNAVSVKTQVDTLIRQATDPENLSRMFHGWQAFL